MPFLNSLGSSYLFLPCTVCRLGLRKKCREKETDQYDRADSIHVYPDEVENETQTAINHVFAVATCDCEITAKSVDATLENVMATAFAEVGETASEQNFAAATSAEVVEAISAKVVAEATKVTLTRNVAAAAAVVEEAV